MKHSERVCIFCHTAISVIWFFQTVNFTAAKAFRSADIYLRNKKKDKKILPFLLIRKVSESSTVGFFTFYALRDKFIS